MGYYKQTDIGNSTIRESPEIPIISTGLSTSGEAAHAENGKHEVHKHRNLFTLQTFATRPPIRKERSE